MELVPEALVEETWQEVAGFDEDLPDMTDDDIGYLFLLLKTVIDVLHHATQALNAYDNSL